MSDVQAEAERIVMAAVEATADDLDAHVDRLTAALAAAIEVEDGVRALIVESDRVENGHGDPYQDWTRPLIDKPVRKHHGKLRDALSTLRQTDGEDT